MSKDCKIADPRPSGPEAVTSKVTRSGLPKVKRLKS